MTGRSTASQPGAMFDLSGESAVVIGDGTPVGIDVAVALVCAGADVTLWEPPEPRSAPDVGSDADSTPADEDRAGDTVSEVDFVKLVTERLADLGIGNRESSLHALTVDPGSDDSVSAGFEETCLHASVPGVLVNALAPPRYEAELFDIDMKKFRTTVEMGVLGGMLVPTRGFAAKWMQERIAGSVVTVLPSGRVRSGGGAHALPAARAAIEALTRSTASELADFHIRVNAVVCDDDHPAGPDGAGDFAHIAAAVLYFCTAGSNAGVSGSVFTASRSEKGYV